MDKKEQDIQRLLEAMNKKLEKAGHSYDYPFFNFDTDKGWILQEMGCDVEYLYSLLNCCKSRRYIKKTTLGSGFSHMALTHLGQQQAIYGRLQQREPTMAIGQITINGPAQIGNGNSQFFSNFIPVIEAQIDEAHVSEAEKKEAKNLLVKLSENPLVSSIIGGLISSLG